MIKTEKVENAESGGNISSEKYRCMSSTSPKEAFPKFIVAHSPQKNHHRLVLQGMWAGGVGEISPRMVCWLEIFWVNETSVIYTKIDPGG